MQRQKILIIEDEPAMVLYYTFALEEEYDILSVTSGSSAIEHINHLDDIDLVILDYKLQDMSGITVLKEIKRIKPSLPIIVITAYGDEEVAVSSFRCGAREYIKKPVTYNELFEKVRFCLSLRSDDKNNRAILYHDSSSRTHSGNPCPTVMSRNFLKIQKAVRHINDNYTTRISLDLAAGKACMSRHHFSRTFKRTMGVTFQDYLNDRRMEKAKDMLKSSRLTVTEIAFFVGYADMTHFTKMFKRMTGVTPSQYKNKPAKT
jgi:YesN/AraC family two-component response regulator